MDPIKETILRVGLRRREEGAVIISKKGGLQSWLIDMRRVFMDRQALKGIAALFWEKYQGYSAFQIGGMETAAIPLLTAILLEAPVSHADINAFIVRKDRKATGLGNSVEGDVGAAPVILVDDVINSGSSAEKAKVVIEASGGRVVGLFVVVDYRSKKGNLWRQQHGLPVESLYRLDDFGLSLSNERTQPAQTYRQRWATVTPGGYPFYVVPKSSPLLASGVIYRGSDCGKMEAFERSTGRVIWEYQVTGVTGRKGIWSSPAIHADRLYFGAYNGTAYCLDARNGGEIWAQPYGDWIGASPLIVPEHGLVYFGIEYERPWAQGSIGALDMKTGAKVWEHLTKKFQHGSPAYWRGGDLVIWGTADHAMVGLDARTGTQRWAFATRRSVKYAPAIDESRGWVAFASFDKSIYLLEAATGQKLGEWLTGDICYTTPLFAANRLFCGSGDRHLYVIDLEQLCVIKKIDLGSRVYSSPRQIGNRIIVGTNGGRVVEINARTLDIVGIVQLPDAVTNAVATSDDGRQIFVSTAMNHLYAFERLATSQLRTKDSHATGTLRNFQRVLSGVDTRAIKSELAAHPEFWLANTSRQEKVKVQRETQSIFLRSAAKEPGSALRAEDTHPSKPTALAIAFPKTLAFIAAFAQQRGAHIGRVLFAKLKAHGQVYRHVDGGDYYKDRNRYHLILWSSNGSAMSAGDEEVVMQENELWWFDNKQPHEAFNDSEDDRIHLIFDLEEPAGSPKSVDTQALRATGFIDTQRALSF